jgi:transcriptional regulator with XRE-family HTH domain
MIDQKKAMTEFGSRIKELRTNKGLTVQELASRSNLPASSITDIENGTLDISLIDFYYLSTALDKEPKDLI